MPKTIKLAMRQAAGRSWKQLADERIEGTEPTIPLGKRFWHLSDEERSAVTELFEETDLRRLSVSLRSPKEKVPLRVMVATY